MRRVTSVIENLAKENTLCLSAAEFEPLTLAVDVDKLIRDINNIWSLKRRPTMDDAIFAEFDRNAGGCNPLPRLCRASKTYSITSLPTNSVRYVSMYVVMILNTPTRFTGTVFNWTTQWQDILPGLEWMGLNDATLSTRGHICTWTWGYGHRRYRRYNKYQYPSFTDAQGLRAR